MKRITLLIVGVLLIPFFSTAGGIVTNQNQSAAYIRMFARDASTDIDAVFFNPAGLTKLNDGFYISLNYQYIKQNKVVTSNYVNLATMPTSPTEYNGEINVPIFPGLYAAYKKGKFVVSFGVNPVGGGGGATFDKGLPSFEMPVSDLVPTLQAQDQPVTAYSLNAYFEGSSAFWGYQLGASYEINDIFSIYLGARYVSAKNTYAGHLTDVNITYLGTEISATDFFANAAAKLQPLTDGLGALVLGGAGDLTLDQALEMSIIDATTYAQLTGGLTQAGVPTSVTIVQGFGAVSGAERAAYVLADQDNVEVEQTGSGFTPIIGINISPNDKLNIGLKYEFMTKLELENNTTTDFIIDYDPLTNTPTGMFPDGEKIRNDMPALLAVGFDYKITDKFKVASGFHYYFDKSADYGRKLNGVHVDNKDVIDRNSTEFALGLEYKLSDKMLLSIGYLNTQTGVTEDYQTDLSYSQHSNTVGFGGAYAISKGIDLNVGFGYTVYNDARKIYDATDALGFSHTTIETYDKDNLFVSFGLDFKLGGNKTE
ncbi:MAG TPA: outer membrane protein transport protein [Bacteroidales bacterium]|nr:outer membrane protein transport protein [Bacteroidales bacterium]